MPNVLERLKKALEGRYSVESEIGRGGMATVFLAEDLRHHRKVAIKVLHPELASAVGTERFLNEVEIVAGLEHPHILTLIDSGEADGLLYYVMPYVEGESLRDRLEAKGQLSVEEAVRIAVEVADGLDYAHGKGIVHRDIKPGNILLSGKHAVITDFGIARAITVAQDDRLTGTGLAIGTPRYASPEQATGAETLDGRTDIYSLGCVLYEMLSGEIPLGGPTPQAIRVRRMDETPSPLHAIRPTVSPLLDQAIGKALATLPADRFETAERFAQALIVSTMESTPVAQPDLASIPSLMARPRRAATLARIPRWLLILVPALAVGSLGVWGFVEWQAGIADGEGPADPHLPAPELREIQLTEHGRVWQISPAVSRDGRYVAYSVADRPRTFDMQMARNFTQLLMVVEITDDGVPGEPRLVTQMQDCYRLLWSPDGRHLLVSGTIRESSGLFLVPLAGGRIDKISDTAYGLVDWSPDGSLAVRSRLEIGFLDPLPGGSGELTGRIQLPTAYESIWSLAWSPDGDRLAVAVDSSGVIILWSVTPDGSDARRLSSETHVEDLAWAAEGDAIYFSRGMERQFLRLGPLDGVGTAPVAEPLVSECRWFSVSSDGRRLVCQRIAGFDNFWLKSLDSAVDSVLLTPDTVEVRGIPYLSPAGDRIAYVEGGPEGRDLYIMSLADGTRHRLTHRGDVGGGRLEAAWSPEGDYLAYLAKGPDDTSALWFIPSDGGPSVRAEGVEAYMGLAWSPGEDPIVQTGEGEYTVVEPPDRHWREALADRTILSGARTRPLAQLDSLDRAMSVLAVSPDGSTAAVTRYRDQDESSGVWLFSLDGASAELLYPMTPEFRSMVPVGWSSDGEGVYVRNGADPYLISRATGEMTPVNTPGGFCSAEPVASVGRFLCYDVRLIADLRLIENFDPHAE